MTEEDFHSRIKVTLERLNCGANDNNIEGGEVKDFEIIDHTADVGIAAYGTDIREAFGNAALGLFSLITDPEGIDEKTEREVELSALDEESLLVDWLNELIYIFDVERVAFCRFDIAELSNNHLKARCFGEKIEPSRHQLKMEVKAATYHMLKVGRGRNGCEVRVIFDI